MRLFKTAASVVFLVSALSLRAEPTTHPANLLKDTKLESIGGGDSWQASSLEGGSVKIEKETADAEHPTLKLTVDKVDGTDWHAQIFQSGLTVEKDAKYILTFTAKASASRKIAVFIQELGLPYKMLTDGHAIDLTTESAPQKVELTTKDASSDAKLTIVVGQAAGTIDLSEFSLKKAD